MSKQLIVDWVAAAVKSLHTTPDLVGESFIVTGINTSLNGANDHMVQSDTDIEHIFDSPSNIWPRNFLGVHRWRYHSGHRKSSESTCYAIMWLKTGCYK